MAYVYMHSLLISVVLALVIMPFLRAALVLDTCTHQSQCPPHSGCRPSGCAGYTCRCDVNYVYSDDRRRCIPGKLVGESCDGNLNKCLSPFALCRDGVCRCNLLMEPSRDGLCRAPFEAEIHQSCEEKYCVSSTVCVNGVCECPDEMREITLEEYWFDPFKVRRCVNMNHSLEYCNGEKLPLLSDLSKEDADVTTSSSFKQMTSTDMTKPTDKSDAVLSVNNENNTTDKELVDEKSNVNSKSPLDMLDVGKITSSIQTSEFHDEGAKAVKIQSIRSKEDQDDKDTVAMFSLVRVVDQSETPDEENINVKINSERTGQNENPWPTPNSGIEIDGNSDYPDGFKAENNINTESTNKGAQHNMNINDQNAGYVNNDKVEGESSEVKNKPALGFGLITEEIQNKNMEYQNKPEADVLDYNQERPAIDTQSLNDTILSGVGADRLQLMLKSFISNMLQSNKKVNIYQGCSNDLQCPRHAYCTTRGCNKRNQCLCREGFMSNRNGTRCVPDASRPCLVSEFSCVSSRRCVPLFWVCDGVKDCPNNEDEGTQCAGQSQRDTHSKDRDRLEEKLNHETLMRMHLERSIQSLKEEITRLKDDYSERKLTTVPPQEITSRKPPVLSITAVENPTSWPNADSDIFYQGYEDTIQNLLKKYGVYILWGSKICQRDKNTKTIYSGIMSSGVSTKKKNGVGDILCLPEIPEFDDLAVSGSFKNILKDKSIVSGFSRHITCAFCQVQMISSVQMIPAKKGCPKDWKLEYAGILVTTGSKDGAQSQYICIEKSAMINGGLEDSRGHGPYLTPVTVECGRIPCPPYKQNHYLPCVVCSI